MGYKGSAPESIKVSVDAAGRAHVQQDLKHAGHMLKFWAKVTARSGALVKSSPDGCRITVRPCTKPARLLLSKPGHRPQKSAKISVRESSQEVALHFMKRDKEPVELTQADLNDCVVRVDGRAV